MTAWKSAISRIVDSGHAGCIYCIPVSPSHRAAISGCRNGERACRRSPSRVSRQSAASDRIGRDIARQARRVRSGHSCRHCTYHPTAMCNSIASLPCLGEYQYAIHDKKSYVGNTVASAIILMDIVVSLLCPAFISEHALGY